MTLYQQRIAHVPTFSFHQSQPNRNVSFPVFVFYGSARWSESRGLPCVVVCVIWNGSLRVFIFQNNIDFGLIKVRCHVAGSQNGIDLQCYDWTETNSMFRLLIGICGSYSVDPWSRFRRLHFSYLLSLFSYIYVVLLIILKDN
ncbi:hypothetical protein NC653_033610 [Populus alba x Populus x berolinensis]|uniref:Uncharacterized protein n=1 Tax=Populus alba x Populus x berolinensis TaxID=444605 RepID=A0AAD6LWZ5_9ROSI|nr:hypothetical protein NC653_033610 [Populus alba x Populus x berolinensis]